MQDLTYAIKKESSKLKRSQNRNSSSIALIQQDIAFESKNDGAHLVVTGSKGLIDLWPGTGKWIARAGYSDRGVFSLIKAINSGIV